MNAVLRTVLLVGFFGNVWSGVVYDSGYVIQPQYHHHPYSSGETLHVAGDGSGGYSSSVAGSSQGGYSNSFAGVDSFADPNNRAPAPPAPKPVYGAPSSGYSADPIKNAATDDANSLGEFTKDELDTAIRTQDVVPGIGGSDQSSTTTTEAPIDDEEEIDFTPPRRSLLSRFFSFLTKQFSAIMSFLRRIWGRLRGN